MSVNQTGIMTWVSSIRTTMANDPGRQLLEDQVRTDGFLFLDDYLEGILAKPKLNPIIELVKTPARRRNVPKKMRSGTEASMKGNPIITMDLEEVDSDKENEAPVVPQTPLNKFHESLLQSRDTGPHSWIEKSVEVPVTPPVSRVSPAQNHEIGPPHAISSSDQVELPHGLTKHELVTELSVIEEDEEPAERSRISEAKRPSRDSAGTIQTSKKSSNISAKSPKPYPRKTLPTIDMATVMDIDDFTQTTNFNSLPMSTHSSQGAVVDGSSGSSRALSSVNRTSRGKSRPSTPLDADFSTAPLASDVPLNEVLQEDQRTETATVEEPGLSRYPTIGPPSPLRKSIRIHKEPLSSTIPVTKQTSTRSSWLVKAREAKAIEDSTKKLASAPTASHHVSAGSKRKSGDTQNEDAGRTQKLTKTAEVSPISDMPEGQEMLAFGRFRDETIVVAGDGADDSDGMINKLKKTVAGFSARTGRSMGKSLGGAAATALAEARAAAEAKVAERNAAEGRIVPVPPAVVSREPDGPDAQAASTPAQHSEASKTEGRVSGEKDRRLSVSDLVSKMEKKETRAFERVFQPPPPGRSKVTTGTARDNDTTTANNSTSTTPPNSPPKPRPPIFTLPEKSKEPPVPTFFPPPTTHVLPHLELQSLAPRVPQPIPAHATLFSTQSSYPDSVFDDEVPAWVPSTQGTEFSDHFSSQLPRGAQNDRTEPGTVTDADESWHLDEKFGETWTPIMIGMKDDSMTWSTAPTRSTRSADTGVLNASEPPAPSKSSPVRGLPDAQDEAFEAIPSDNPPCSATDEIDEEDMDVERDEDITSIRLVTPAPKPKNIHLSSQSIRRSDQQETQSALDNVSGFFSSATKLVSSVLGGSKKGKEPVKSLKLAAAAAKKQQEEAEKKANRLKEFEARRQQILRKKVEEDKNREERKAREETERWKREKEKDDMTDKRILKQPGKTLTQVEDDLNKKRKTAEAEKKTEPKKPPVRDGKDVPPSKIGKFALTGSQSGLNASSLASKSGKSTAVTGTQDSTKSTHAHGDAKSGAAGKVKDKTKQTDAALEHPSQLVRSQMQARYQAELGDSRKAQPLPTPVSTESIELPDINSEYSDSDDENRVRTFDPPDWAQSPELREALQSQSTVNPDDIFGAIRPLKMEELFKNRTSRFRARTSSAIWAGADELTAHEEREYARRMGYKS